MRGCAGVLDQLERGETGDGEEDGGICAAFSQGMLGRDRGNRCERGGIGWVEELGRWLEADVSLLYFFSFFGFLVGGVARRRFGALRWEPRMFGTTWKLMRR